MPEKNLIYNRQLKDAGVFINLMSDTGFKQVFLQDEKLFIKLLSAVLPEVKVKSFKLLDKEKPGNWKGAKKSIFDVLCEVDNGSRIIIEIQVRPQQWFRDRALYYSALEILGQHQQGDRDNDYSLLPVYVISFLDFVLEHEKDSGQYVWRYDLKERECGEMMTEALHFVFIELPKFRKNENEIGNLEEYFYFCLQRIHSFVDSPKGIGYKTDNGLIRRAMMQNLTKDEQQKYTDEMNNEWDIQNQKAYAWKTGLEEGRAKGIEEGRAEEKLAIARNFKEIGISVADIAKATGLSEEEITRL